MIEYLFPSSHKIIEREEQDRQEILFSQYQIKLKNGTLKKSESDDLFAIIHNCILSQLKRRVGGLSSKQGVAKKMYEGYDLEEMALDGTIRLLEAMKKGRYVRYIIKTADYEAMFQMYEPKKKFENKLFRSRIDIDRYNSIIAEVNELEEAPNGEIKIKSKIINKKEI